MSRDRTSSATGAGGGRWNDLGPRLGSSAGLAAVGIAAVYLGGVWFIAFAALIAGIIVWELSVMADADAPLLLAFVASLSVVGLVTLPSGWGLPLLFAPLFAAFGRVARARIAHGAFLTGVVLGTYGLIDLRTHYEPHWLVWLILVVIVTDVAGYLAGRSIGGPKFWPRVSPKKTWSGTIAGWLAAATVGLGAVWWGMSGLRIVAISVAVSMASQLGDIAESALKRRLGVKDSSRLLPGHGGFFDRFDGVLGAAILIVLVEATLAYPPVMSEG